MNAVYPYGENLYLNLTTRCPAECVFCVKHQAGRRFRGIDLALEHEPGIDEAWRAVLERTAGRLFNEFVFCGYGESTYRLGAVLELARRLKRCYPRSGRRLNTIGLGSLVWRRDIVPELALSLTAVSVSLNTADPAQWKKLHRPAPRLSDHGYEAVLEFIRACVLADLAVTVTAVELPGVDLPAVRRLAASLGAAFRARPALDALEAAG